MTGSARKSSDRPMDRAAILKAMKTPPPGGYHVRDGVDEDDRPATEAKIEAGLAAARKARGWPPGSTKASTTIRIDQDVLEAFRADGAGWQSRMNAALREWLQSRAKAV